MWRPLKTKLVAQGFENSTALGSLGLIVAADQVVVTIAVDALPGHTLTEELGHGFRHVTKLSR